MVEEYLPDAIRGERIVQLSESGLEQALGERLRCSGSGAGGDGGTDQGSGSGSAK